MDEILLETEQKMEKTIESLLNRFSNVHAGRANPSMLDTVKVSYYGVDTPLNQLATISVPEARKLQIKPFDKTAMQDIIKGIYEADLGLTPNDTGDVIFISIPELTEDRRKELVKQIKKMSEEAKISLRNIRQDANNQIKRLELNEDEEKAGENEVQDLINKYNKLVDEKTSNKEKDLMTI